jgi:sugar/nucleoside kinase (ribokinase family)
MREYESLGNQFLRGIPGVSSKISVILRAGEIGCALFELRQDTQWFLSYYSSNDPHVVNTTGAGNAFLGGFLIALNQGQCMKRAAIYGTVAASFVLEQIGMRN